MLKQVLLRPTVVIRQEINEHSCKSGLAANCTKHGLFGDRSNSAVAYRCCCNQTYGHVMKAGFSKKLSLLRCPNLSFCAILKRRQSDASILNEIYEGSIFALAENLLVVLITCRGSTGGDPNEKSMSVNLIRQNRRLHGVARSVSPPGLNRGANMSNPSVVFPSRPSSSTGQGQRMVTVLLELPRDRQDIRQQKKGPTV